MALDQDKLELINAVIDGEATDAERSELEALLARDAEASAAHDELARLVETLDAVEAIPPPPHLKHQVLDRIGSRRSEPPAHSLWVRIWGAPTVRYAGAFAAGVVLAAVFVSSDRISRHAFDDVTGLVGTLSQGRPVQSVDLQSIAVDSRLTLSSSEIAGTVQAQRAGPIMIIDFDLVSGGPIDIVADFTEGDIWFNGFAQLENTGTMVSADVGKVTLQMEGKRRYAVYLYNGSGAPATVGLKFYAEGELIHEDEVRFGDAD